MNLVETLLAEDPAVHTELAGGAQRTYGLLPSVLEWLDANIRPEWSTLETGCGLSTAVFAARSAAHFSISPFASESDYVRRWCAQHDIGLEHVRFIDEYSEWVLPKLDVGLLDLVLVDGAHAFPQVFIDWYYASQSLKVDGLLLIDDLPLWTGRVLCGFLAEEAGWAFVRDFQSRTALFRKTAPMDPSRGFRQQPYVERQSAVSGWRAYLTLLRHRELRGARDRAQLAVERRRPLSRPAMSSAGTLHRQ